MLDDVVAWSRAMRGLEGTEEPRVNEELPVRDHPASAEE
jgi:hypothetical protein